MYNNGLLTRQHTRHTTTESSRVCRMMKTWARLCLATLLPILLPACQETDKRTFPTTQVDVNQDLPADSFFTGYSYIQLDSVTTPMLSEVQDIRLLGDDLFILDKAGRIFRFTAEGHLTGTIDKQGLDREQYATADAFDVTEAGIFVLCRAQKRIMQYDFAGNLTRIHPLNDYYLDMRVMADSTIVLASGNCNSRMQNFVTYDLTSQMYIHEAEPFTRTESFISDTYHPFAGKGGRTLYVTDPYQTKVMAMTGGTTTPLREYTFNTPEQLPKNQDEYTFEELAQMAKHKPIVRGIAMYSHTKDAEYVGYELFGKCGLSYLLARTKADGTVQNMTIMNNPEPDYPYLSAPICTTGDSVISILPAYVLLQIEQAYKIDTFTSKGLHATDNPVVFIHKLR